LSISACFNGSRSGEEANTNSNSKSSNAIAAKTGANVANDESIASKSNKSADGVPDILPGLEPEYYEDADGNGVPNFMKIEMGKDPAKDDCPQSECGDPGDMLKYFQSPHNTLLMLDSSGSMRSKNRMTKAKEILAGYVSKRQPENFKTGFLVYGHRGSVELLNRAGNRKSPRLRFVL